MNGKTNFGALGKVAVVGGAPAVSDFHQWLHPDIAIASAPMPLLKLTSESLSDMGNKLSDIFDLFKTYDRPDLAFFSCTSGSLIGGKGYDRQLCKLCRETSGAKEGFTTSTAVLHSLDAVGAKRITIITPYPDSINAKEATYFEANGFIVNNIEGIKTENPQNQKLICKIPSEAIYDFAINHMSPKSDALFLSCTGLLVLDIIKELESMLSVPVITSNQASIWLIGNYFGKHRQEAENGLGELMNITKNVLI